MKANGDKCYLLFAYDTNITAKVTDFNVKNSTEEKLLGIKFGAKSLYQNNVSSFIDLLEQNNSVTIHQRNLQVLVTEICKLRKDLAPDITKNLFEITKRFYSFRSKANHSKREHIRTTKNGIQSVRLLGPNIWDLVPNNIRNCNSLNKFKKLIKSRKLNACPYRLCKNYVAQASFVN